MSPLLASIGYLISFDFPWRWTRHGIAAACPGPRCGAVELHGERLNRAFGLYMRFGFWVVADAGVYVRMEREPFAEDRFTSRAVMAVQSAAAQAHCWVMYEHFREPNDDTWPALPYPEWKATLTTVHMWTQIVGKVKLELTPFLNQWWNITFAVTARGLTTSTIPFGSRVFQVDFDFIDHRLAIHVSDGTSSGMSLAARPVSDFYREFMTRLESLGIQVKINTLPVEVDNGIRFEDDQVHADYDPLYVSRWWRILLQIGRVMERYRTPFVGKSSSVQFWWGSFDLSTTRFSGRPAPPRAWPARWMALGADQEEAAAGFWPGNDKLPEPAFVAYTYPEPPGCRIAPINPDAAYFHPELAEFVLPYEKVRLAADPAALILDFYRSSYEVGATLAGWDRAALERSESGPSVGSSSGNDSHQRA